MFLGSYSESNEWNEAQICIDLLQSFCEKGQYNCMNETELTVNQMNAAPRRRLNYCLVVDSKTL